MKNLEQNIADSQEKLKAGNRIFETQSTDGFTSILKIFFKEIIDEETLNAGVILYSEIEIDGRVDEFLVDFENFKELIEDNSQHSFCKFYLLTDNDSLSMGLVFSDHEEIEPDTDNDLLFILQGNDFVLNKEEFITKREDFLKLGGLGQQIGTFSIKMTEVIQYNWDTVSIYNLLVSHSYKVEKLKFKMFKYPSNYKKKSGYADRISFAVNPVMTGLNDNKTKSFDAGDLKP